MSDQEILKIEIPPEPEDDAPLVAEATRPGVAQTVGDRAGQVGKQVGQTLAGAGKKAWDSDLRKQATSKATAVANSAIHKGSEIVREQVAKTAEQQAQAAAQRVKETDWQETGKQGVAGGLRWLSDRLSKLADRFTPVEKQPPADEQQT